MHVDAHEISILNVCVSLLIGHVIASLLVSEPQAVAKVDHVNKGALAPQTYYKILQSKVSINIS